MTHYYGDLCPGGHGAAPMTRVGLDDQLTPRGADGQAERVRTAVETLTAAAETVTIFVIGDPKPVVE